MRFLFSVCFLAVILAVLAVGVLALGLAVAKLLSMIVGVPLAEVLVAASILTALTVHFFIKFLSLMYASKRDDTESVADDDMIAVPRNWLYPRRRHTRRPKTKS